MIQPGMSPLQMLTDPDEGPFLQSIAISKDLRPEFAGYADFLSRRDPLRSELLRLAGELSGPDRPTGRAPAQQTRFTELLGALETFGMWLQLVRDFNRVLNCGTARTALPVVRFSFECPNRWESLAPTAEAGVRHCAECGENVYYCDAVASAEQHARSGHCIAVPRPVVSAVGERQEAVTGRPDVHQLWGEELFRR